MNILDATRVCPNCGVIAMSYWDDLSTEEKLIVEKLSGATEFTEKERKRHLFCKICWFEMEYNVPWNA